MKSRNSILSRTFDVMNHTIFFIVMIVMLYPFLYVLSTSFSNPTAIAEMKVKLLPVEPTLIAYSLLFEKNEIMLSYLNTIFYTVTGTFFSLSFQTLAAYGLVRKPNGYKIVVLMMTITMFFGGGMIPTYMVIKTLRMIDTFWSVTLPGSVGVWTIFVMRSYFKTIPESLYDASYIDGASEFRIYLNVILPISIPMIATMGLFAAVGQWNSFFGPLLYLNDPKKWPLQIVLQRLIISGEVSKYYETYIGVTAKGKYGLVFDKGTTYGLPVALKCAAIIVTTGPILLVYPYIQKYFMKGIMMGSLKG